MDGIAQPALDTFETEFVSCGIQSGACRQMNDMGLASALAGS